MKSEPSIKIEEFSGLNNMAEARAMLPGELIIADNIDIDDRKKIRRRPGSEARAMISDVQSAWTTPDEKRMFVVHGGMLSEVYPDFTVHDLFDGFDERPVYFDWDTERVFAVSEKASVVIDGDQVYPLRVDTPLAPTVIPTSGNLPAGTYLVGVVNEDGYGRQGGCSALRSVTLREGSGILIGAHVLPGYLPRIYVSEANGQSLHLLSVGDENVVFDSLVGLSARLEEPQYTGMPTPLGGPIAYHEGRLHVADGGIVYRSHPYWPHLFDLAEQGYILPGKVTLLASLEAAGLLIGTDRGIYVSGPDEQLTQLADYGVVPGPQNHFRYDEDGAIKVYFWTERGLAVAPPFQLLMEGRVSAAPGDVCAMGLVEQDGFKKLVISTRLSDSRGAPNAR